MSKRFNIAFENTTNTDGELELQNELLGDGFNPDDDSVDDQISNAVAIEEIANELEADLTDNNRTIDVADSLGDIQTIVENTPEDGQIDTNLVQTAANMAVAGTDVSAQDIVPSMESFADRALAVEAIGEKIKGALTSVFNSAKEIGTKIGNFVKETFKSISYLEKRINDAKTKLATIDKKATTEITFKGKDFLMKDDGSLVDSFEDFKNSFNRGSATLNKVSPIIVDAVVNLSGSVRKFISSTLKMDMAKQSELGKELYQVVVLDTVKKFKSIPGAVVDNSDENNLAKKGDSYKVPMGLGGYNFNFSVPKDIPKITDDAEKQRQAAYHVDFTLSKNLVVAFKATSVYELNANVKLSDLAAILNTAEKNVASLKSFLEKTFKQTRMLNANVRSEGFKDLFKNYKSMMSLQAILMNHSLHLQTKFVRSFYMTGYSLTTAGVKFVEQGIRGLSGATKAE